jgi:hypothetical protein
MRPHPAYASFACLTLEQPGQYLHVKIVRSVHVTQSEQPLYATLCLSSELAGVARSIT